MLFHIVHQPRKAIASKMLRMCWLIAGTVTWYSSASCFCMSQSVPAKSRITTRVAPSFVW